MLQNVLDQVPEFNAGKVCLKEELLSELGPTIVRATPLAKITGDTLEALTNEVIFTSQCFINTSNGQLSQQTVLSFRIPARTWEEAIVGWRAAAQQAIVEFSAQQIEQQKRIIVPALRTVN